MFGWFNFWAMAILCHFSTAAMDENAENNEGVRLILNSNAL